MRQVQLHFYGTLNDLIAPGLRNAEINHGLNRKTSVKDMIESFGVPHPEVALILVNGTPVSLDYIVKNGDHICVHPSCEGFNVTPLLQPSPKQLHFPRFVVDANLGRLARYLRLLGFDCLYRNDYSDAAVAEIARDKDRIVLTRDRMLLQRKIIAQGYFVRAVTPKIQVKEVLKRFDLYHQIKPFIRCIRCNGKLEKTEKEKVEHRLEPLTKRYYDNFLICAECSQIYWQGSHYTRTKRLIEEFSEAGN